MPGLQGFKPARHIPAVLAPTAPRSPLHPAFQPLYPHRWASSHQPTAAYSATLWNGYFRSLIKESRGKFAKFTLSLNSTKVKKVKEQ